MVKHIFITISFKEIGNLTLKDGCDILLKLNKYAKVIGVTEKHMNGIDHYHIVAIIKDGLSKHTYRKTIRDLYPIVGGHGIDVDGIRNITKIGKYILKNIKDPLDVYTINTNLQDFILKYMKSSEIYMYYSILIYGRGSLDDWLNDTLENRVLYFKNSKKVHTIWDFVNKGKIRSLDKIKHIIITTELDVSKPITFIKQEIPFSQCVLLIKFCIGLFASKQWKRTNLLISGLPNIGKTSFLKKFEEVWNCQLYWAPARVGDLSGFDPKHGIIVLDDIISLGHKWPLAILLKILGREGFKGDAKMSNIIDIPKDVPVVVITNTPDLFLSYPAIRARLFHINLIEKFSWLDLTKEQIIFIFYLTIDGIQHMSRTEIQHWNYATKLSDINGKYADMVRQLQLAINSILTEQGNIQPEFPVGIYNAREGANVDRYGDNFIQNVPDIKFEK